MANSAHVDKLKEGVVVWNRWRAENTEITPDLSHANLDRASLSRANLRHANLEVARLIYANLRDAHLEGARLMGAWLDASDLRGAHMEGADLFGAYISHADLRRADLRGSTLERVNMVNSKLEGADLSGARVYGISAWDLQTDATTVQRDLVLSPSVRAIGRTDAEAFFVDDLEVAQFIYLMLNSEKIRNVLTTIGNKGVLLLGRFSPERKAVLDALRNSLRRLNYVPMMFDFENAKDRTFTETIKTLAGLSRFIIADVTNPRSAPLKLQATVPDYMVPLVPILEEGEEPFSMLGDLQLYDWVMPVKKYRNIGQLLQNLESKIIRPALRLHAELQLKKAQRIQIESLDD